MGGNKRSRGLSRGASGPWYGQDHERALFELGARRYPGLVRTTDGRGLTYRVPVSVPFSGRELVEIRFGRPSPRTPLVFWRAAKVKHQYPDGSLCMWHPSDPPDDRWVFEDGLLKLIGYVIAHLFREKWFVATGEWLGPEAGHGEKSRAA